MNGIQTLVKAIGLFQALIVAAPLAFATIHQNITIQLNPAQETIKAVAEIAPSTTADSPGMLLFWLNKDLQAKTPQPGVSIRKMDTVGVSSLYMVKFGGNTPSIKVEYYGSLASGPIKPISTEGVALMGNNRWYPAIDHQDYTFRITSETPAGWLTVSHDEQISETQKGQKLISVWESTSAQEDIYLISNRWHRFEKKDKGVVHRVYLMQPDAQLAEKYLKSTAQYLGLYSQMIGAYPYKQMATVENYWETGYGMPSFTLLGPKVIRFPFIFYSSFPHEILHNWWGNGVYVNLEMGNWCEGLTSYMADHYFQEMRGNGDSYRRTALLNFSVFASSGSDFPLKDFVSRHDKNSSAVGYSKGMMFFHMLKKTVGEASFAKSFREFYQEHLHRPASFEDIKNSFAKNTSTSLDQFFNQWLERTGAPKLEILNVLQQKSGAGSFQVSFELNQIHRGKPYELSVPMVFEFADGSTPVKQVYSMTDFKNRPSFTFSKRVARLSVDPEFDVFRYLYPSEIPESVSKLFGQKQTAVLILPSAGTLGEAAYLDWAKEMKGNFENKVQVVWDNEVTAWPKNSSIFILGTKNKFVNQINEAGKTLNFVVTGDVASVNGTDHDLKQQTVFAVLPHPANSNSSLAWLSAPNSTSLARSAAKIPHYGKYSVLVFLGEQNQHKSQWPIRRSPLIHEL